jgi:hypothetical protein
MSIKNWRGALVVLFVALAVSVLLSVSLKISSADVVIPNHVASQGRTLAPAGRLVLYVANAHSNSIAVVSLSPESRGEPTRARRRANGDGREAEEGRETARRAGRAPAAGRGDGDESEKESEKESEEEEARERLDSARRSVTAPHANLAAASIRSSRPRTPTRAFAATCASANGSGSFRSSSRSAKPDGLTACRISPSCACRTITRKD